MPSKFLPRDRAWGTRYDTLGSSPPSSPTLQRSATENVHSSTISPTSPRELLHSVEGLPALEGRPPEKPDHPDTTPHDASIFVGSLPANVDHTELSRRLCDHLSAYPQIKGIKVVRDSRGGVCAFVQCDSPLAAGELLASLQAHPPLPFLGRSLRFEPAKAYRTLLLSYRTPAGLALAHTDGLSDEHSATKPRLAYAMRIFRPRNAKYLGLVYDEDATNFSLATATESSGNPQDDKFSGEGYLINPLKYDEETLRGLAAAFGPLETFKEHTSSSITSPHDAPRTSEMSQCVWEVKWKDREDSVAALLTLRRVPHLNVSWAHHPPSSTSPIGRFPQTGLFMPTSPWSPTAHRSNSDHRAEAGARLPGMVLPAIRMPPPSTPSQIVSTVSPKGPSSMPADWSTMTSPTLGRGAVRADATRWADQMAELDFNANGALSPSQSVLHTSTPILRQHNGFATPALAQDLAEPFSAVDSFPEAHIQSPPQTSARRPLTATDRVPIAGPTGFDASGSPHHGNGVRRVWTGHAPVPPFQRDSYRELDPTTVFVGGLEVQGPHGWDENKLRHIFGRFGIIENIHLVAPVNKRTAFAFVKFANEAAASRAVREEHNRVYGERPIRVQLRDRNGAPSRGTWRPGRGRGRGLSGPPQFRQDPMSNEVAGVVADDALADMLADAQSPEPAVGYSVPAQDFPVRTSPPDDRFAAAQPTGLPANERPWQDGLNNSFSSLSSSTTKVPSVHYEMSRGPPSTAASMTPPPSNLSASTSASASMPAPYPMNMGYYPQQPWVQPYPAAYPYPVPVMPGYGYPAYPYAPVHPMAPAYVPGDSNSNGNSTSTQWNGAGGSDGASKNMAGSTNAPSAPAGHLAQPPLRATSFIQNEHGALIPVYQREALDEYMAHAHHGRQLPHPPPAGAQSQGPPQPASASTPPEGVAWQPSLPMYPGPYPMHMQPVPSMPVPPAHQPQQPRLWMSGPMPYGVPAFHPQNPHATHGMPGPVAPVSAASVNHQHARPVPPAQGQPHVAQRSRQPPAQAGNRAHMPFQMGPVVTRPPSAAAGDRSSVAMRDVRGNGRSRGHSLDPMERVRC